MSENSLFAYLLRSPWWISVAVALVLVLAARFVVPDEYVKYALSFAVPFMITAVMAAWKQRDVPSEARVESTLEAVSAMSWRDFSALLEQAYQRDGHTVTRRDGAADFTLVKGNRTMLLCAKRWKAANHGLEPLRELDAERRAQEANEAIYVAAGTVTDNARRFAAANRIRLMEGSELTRLLRLAKGAAKKR
ncbi:MAG: restriction endonuclease [Proteobacteria bacterium]|nr:restriction endonuclease [Pseudomonadota bacterium]